MPTPESSPPAFKLREAVERPERATPTPLAKTSRLSDADVQKILSRLTPLKKDEGDEQPFALRERSQPPPRTGETIQAPFPPPVAPAAPETSEAGPLRVLRHSPDGEVPLAPRLSVTFSQPMVAVTSYAELEKLAPPLIVSPQPPGRWRWIGTKTVLFEAAGALERLPMATVYTVEVPAGTRSATGGALAKAERFTFSTPAPRVTQFHPQNGPTTREPLLFIAFDQRIDPKALLPTVKAKAGGKEVALRLATAEEIESDAEIARRVAAEKADAHAEQYLVLRPARALPVDTAVSVRVGPGTPSAEGPRKTEKAQEYSFRTYGPMKIVERSCRSWLGGDCPPYAGFWVHLSNPLDTKKFNKDMVTIQPEVPGLKVVGHGSSISLSGALKGRTKYKVTFSGRIPDAFGQTMGKDEVVTFKTGKADKALFSSGGPFVVLDPVAKAKYPVYTVNYESVKVKLFAAQPSDWERFSAYVRDDFRRDKYPDDPPLKAISSHTVPIKADADALTETAIDLSPALSQGLGNVVVLVEPPSRPKNRWEWSPILVWVQSTSIGLDAMVDGEELVAWANSLSDGKPLGGVSLSLEPSGVKGLTADNGIARLSLSPKPDRMLVARSGDQIAFLPEHTQFYSETGSWGRSPEAPTLRWYVADDRHLYKPGEQVHLKGWIRVVGGGESGDVGALDASTRRVEYAVKDSRQNEVAKGTAQVNALGGFDAAFKLPPAMNLGNASVQFRAVDSSLSGREHFHGFSVQEFRRPEFEVSTQPSDGPYFAGSQPTVTAKAKYYAGGGLTNAETTWRVTSSRGHFTPPNRDDFVFGRQPSWFDSYAFRRPGPGRGMGGGFSGTLQGRTDSSGKHVLGIDLLPQSPPETTTVVAEATVMDVNRQAWSASSTLLVHPASLYVGLKTARGFVQAGEAIKVDAIAVDLDGKAVSGKKLQLRSVRLDWEYGGDGVKTVEVDGKECTVTSAAQAQRCEFRPAQGGLYRLSAWVTDDEGRQNYTELTLWVAGGKLPPKRDVQLEEVKLLSDKKEYRAGDTAEVLVIPPFYPAEGVLTLRRSGIFHVERFTLAGPSHTLKIKIDEAWTPNVFVQVDLVGSAPRTNDSGEVNDKLPKRPAVASGQLSLSIPPLARALALTVKPQADELEPGGKTDIELVLQDAAGRPVSGGEIAVVVVDEAVLALSNYRLADPLTVFYTARSPGARDYHLRQSLLLHNPEDLAGKLKNVEADGALKRTRSMMVPQSMPPPSPMMMESGAAAMAKEAAQDAGAEPIKVRSDFNALALFAPDVKTDDKGKATVAVKLPDNLTRYRVMAVAVAGAKQFGSGEATLTARLPLMVRPSAPRFLNFGDKLELPVVLQNQTDRPMEVSVAMRAANLELTSGAGQKVTVPANDRVEIRFPAAAMKAGIARFQLGAVASAHSKWSDAAEVQLPVWTPATTEAFATYGVIDQGAISQPVKTPDGVFPQFGGLEVTTSSTALQALTDAVLYLVRYPYECSEQMASRVLAVAGLKDVLSAFEAEGLPPPSEIVASVKRDVEMLRRLQNSDGGWGFWRRGDESWPFVSLHVAHALARAKEKGFDVPAETLESALPYLKDIEKHIPHYYPVDAKRALIAYSLYVRQRLGDGDADKAKKLISQAGGVEKLPLEAVAWVWPVLASKGADARDVSAIRNLVANRIEETAGAAHFVTSYNDGNYLLLHSDRRVDALLLEGLILDQPKSDIIPKLVTGLLGHRTKGHWQSTQENAWVLLALDKYFNTYEKTTPDFIAKVWLGARYAGEHPFKGRTTERHNIGVPMKWLVEKGSATSDLVLAKEGAGRLYYRIGMSYASTDLRPPARDNGFLVTRTYESVDDKDDVRRDADGTWRVKTGARVRVRLNMVAPARRTHVALVDPLPAGLEALNPALAVTGEVPRDPKAQAQQPGWWWWRPWYEHQNMRDERVEAFTSLLWEGVHPYSYVARATTPGQFVVPPPTAEEMYEPETFGRGAGDRLVVE